MASRSANAGQRCEQANAEFDFTAIVSTAAELAIAIRQQGLTRQQPGQTPFDESRAVTVWHLIGPLAVQLEFLLGCGPWDHSPLSATALDDYIFARFENEPDVRRALLRLCAVFFGRIKPVMDVPEIPCHPLDDEAGNELPAVENEEAINAAVGNVVAHLNRVPEFSDADVTEFENATAALEIATKPAEPELCPSPTTMPGFYEATPTSKLAAMSDDATLNHVEIAERLGLDESQAEALRQRLNRWRKNNPGKDAGWNEITERRARMPKYVYRIGAIRHILNDVVARK